MIRTTGPVNNPKSADHGALCDGAPRSVLATRQRLQRNHAVMALARMVEATCAVNWVGSMRDHTTGDNGGSNAP